MNKTQYIETIRDARTIHLSTERSASILLNGSYKSSVKYDLASYADFVNDDTIEYITVSIPYVVIPNSTYIVNENNNRLDISYNGIATSVYFPYGNYSTASFMTQFINLLPSSVWTITQNALNSTFTIGFKTFPFVLLSTSTINYIMGFNENVVSAQSLNGGYYYLTMPYVYNFLPIPNYIIHMDLINNGITLGNLSAISTSDVLLSVPNNGRNNTQTIYENNSNEFLLKNYSCNNLIMRITDSKNRELNFNGVSSYLTLRFNIYRRTLAKLPKFNELIFQAHDTLPEIYKMQDGEDI